MITRLTCTHDYVMPYNKFKITDFSVNNTFNYEIQDNFYVHESIAFKILFDYYLF